MLLSSVGLVLPKRDSLSLPLFCLLPFTDHPSAPLEPHSTLLKPSIGESSLSNHDWGQQASVCRDRDIMFCTSLRKRPEWASVPKTLLSSKSVRWEEKSLDTYDIAIALPQSRHDVSLTLFHLLALSPCDLEDQASVMARIQHLYHHIGGQNAGIIFLLNEKTPKTNGTIAMMNLQASLFSTLDLPIIPLFSPTTLETTLSTFQGQLVSTRLSKAPSPINPAISLLPYCTNNPPLPEHARNVVSDICQDLSEVSHIATSADGKRVLESYLDEAVPGAAQDLVEFWAEEILLY